MPGKKAPERWPVGVKIVRGSVEGGWAPERVGKATNGV